MIIYGVDCQKESLTREGNDLVRRSHSPGERGGSGGGGGGSVNRLTLLSYALTRATLRLRTPVTDPLRQL